MYECIANHQRLFYIYITLPVEFLHSVYIILFTLLLVYLVLHASPRHSPHHCSHLGLLLQT